MLPVLNQPPQELRRRRLRVVGTFARDHGPRTCSSPSDAPSLRRRAIHPRRRYEYDNGQGALLNVEMQTLGDIDKS